MFESAELGHTIRKSVYDKELPLLREELLKAQFEVATHARFPVIIVIAGVDGSGKGDTVNLLNEWMDPRHIQNHAYGEPSHEERERPAMWRFWRDLPPKGEVGIFYGSWYTNSIQNRVMGRTRASDLEAELDEIVRFEKMLVDEGALIIKFWLHLSKEAQRTRFKTLEKDPATRWRVTPEDWRHFKKYDRYRKVSELTLRQTSRAEAPWIVVEGADANYRSLTVGRAIRDAIRAKLKEARRRPHVASTPPLLPSIDHKDVLHSLDLSLKLGKVRYKRELEKQRGRLALLSRDPRFRDMAVIVVFEGSDAAGKGGTIRRITGALDARRYSLVPVAAPTEEERAQPYLWRFWRHVPGRGRFTIYDRSWYGRVLVERVEGFCTEADWLRAYNEINDFEAQLAGHRIVVVKFWLAISLDEQLSRFKRREKTPFKQFKITKEDWRNRKKWDLYGQAVCDMVDRTSTDTSPWHLIEANDKYYARIKVLSTLCETIERALG
jgi:polyphosphate:AMP phosphotransferase